MIKIIKINILTLISLIVVIVGCDLLWTYYKSPRAFSFKSSTKTRKATPDLTLKNSNFTHSQEYNGLKKEFLGSLFTYHPLLGTVNLPSTSRRVRLSYREKILADVLYEIDRYGRRIYPVSNVKKSNAMLVFGGSFVFGDSLAANQTLTHFIDKYSDKYRPYNLGLSGSGTNQLAALLQHSHVANGVSEKVTVGIYAFIPHHIYRAIGASSSLRYQPAAPYYKLVHDKIKYLGLFAEQKPISTAIKRYLGYSSIFNSIDSQLPFISDFDLHFVCKLVSYSRDLFESQFPDATFYIMIHPLNQTFDSLRNRDLFINCLKREKVEMISFNLSEYSTSDLLVPKDLHPNGIANELTAQKLLKFIP